MSIDLSNIPCPVIMMNGEGCGLQTLNYVLDSKRRCIFHHQIKSGGHTDSFIEEFKKKLQSDMANPLIAALDFTGFVFPEYDFNKFTFGKSTCFRGVEFQKISFRGCEFSGDTTDFSEARFYGEITDFSQVKFGNQDLKLQRLVFFKNSIFKGNSVNFAESTFNCEFVSFMDATFEAKRVVFDFAQFLCKKIDFTETEFKGGVDYTDEVFGSLEQKKEGQQSLCLFRRTSFLGSVNFGGTSFLVTNADFTDAKFIGEVASFSGAQFSGKEARFWGTVFRNHSTYFDATVFDGEKVTFLRTSFEGDFTLFSLTSFSSRVTDFSLSHFEGKKLVFDKVVFDSERTEFSNCVFESEVSFIADPSMRSSVMFPKPVSMQGMKIKKDGEFYLQHVDLSQVEFRGTDLRRIQFIDVEWASINRLRLWFKSKRFKALYDEKKINDGQGMSKSDIELIKLAYQHLTQNYDEVRNYGDADEFYFGKMEMSRLLKPNSFQRNFFSWEVIYKVVSGYGQIWENSLFFLILVFLGWPAVLLLSGLSWCMNGQVFPANYWHSLQYSFLILTFQKDIAGKYSPEILTRNLAVVETLIVPVLIALFFLALKRRFKR